MRKTNTQKGITLIALIITIVVLLILAVVAIRAVQGDGILSYAKNARDDYKRTSTEENQLLQNLTDYITNHSTVSETDTDLEPGLYDAEGNKTKTWQQLIDKGLITITNDGVTLAAVDSSLSGKLVISEGITKIDAYAFMIKGPGYSCTNLTEVILPDSLVEIGYGAFWGCTGLTSITIPDNVTIIRANTGAFVYCTNLTTIYYNGDTTNAPWGATNANVIGTIGYIGPGLYDVEGNKTKTWQQLIDEGLIGITDNGTNLSRVDSSLSGKLVISEDISIINDYAFMAKGPGYSCTNLTEVILPDSLVEIGYGAFQGCTGLTSVTIPNRETTIMTTVFRECTNLKTIYYNGDTTNAPWGAPDDTEVISN